MSHTCSSPESITHMHIRFIHIRTLTLDLSYLTLTLSVRAYLRVGRRLLRSVDSVARTFLGSVTDGAPSLVKVADEPP